jgi:uncharacterized protein (DUF362 family)
MKKISRREFIRKALYLGAGTVAAGVVLKTLGCSPDASTSTPFPTVTATLHPTPTRTVAPVPSHTPTGVPTPTPAPGGAYLAVARGGNPTAIVQAAVRALGGIEAFVKRGDDVIIKPNICVAYHTFEYAATTNPEVVGALVALCLGAGARRVRVMDQPFGGTPEEAYSRSGIAEIVKAMGGQMEVMSHLKYQETPIPNGVDIKSWPIYRDVVEADVLINIPIAKHHNLARATLGMKNLLGVVRGPGGLHSNLGQRIADLNSCVHSKLTVVDCVRVLMNHGPTGGSLSDVKLTNTVIASHDIVAADAYAASLFNLKGEDIPAVRAAAQMGLGMIELGGLKVQEISVGG